MDRDAFGQIAGKALLLLVLVAVNGFFVAAEFALVKIRETQLDALVIKGNRRARVARAILANLTSFLSATQLGITMASLGLGWVGEPLFNAILGPALSSVGIHSEGLRHSLSFALGFSALTFLHITVGELAPKWSAIANPLNISLWVSQPLKWFYLASYPFNWLLNRSASLLLRQIGIEVAGAEASAHSEDELRLLLGMAQKRAGASALGREIVLNALDLRRRLAREVMRPRQEIAFIDTEATIAECLDLAEKTRYSRFPICEKANLDNTLGVLHIKDLYAMRLKARSGRDLLAAARKLIYVPETARLEKVLQLFLERKLHFGIVVDEYGVTVGMLTLENILEELVGQIQDEFDTEKPLLVKSGEFEWDIAGALPLHELEEIVGQPLREEGITTVSGWVIQKLGGFARHNDVVPMGNYELRVQDVDGVRIERLKLTRITTTGSSVVPEPPMI
jgi:CBS domain containing-hemolysin-like protein